MGTINYTPSKFYNMPHLPSQMMLESGCISRIEKTTALLVSVQFKQHDRHIRTVSNIFAGPRKISNNSSYNKGNELNLRTSEFYKETTHDLDFSQYTVNVVEWGGISETDMPTFASAAMENAVISWREFGEINYVADSTGSSLESVEFHQSAANVYRFGIMMTTACHCATF